jgi:hypothetical protein
MSNSNDYDWTSVKVSESTTYYYDPYKTYPEVCPHRLPCGYCRVLMRDCPKYYTTPWVCGDPNIKVTP